MIYLVVRATTLEIWLVSDFLGEGYYFGDKRWLWRSALTPLAALESKNSMRPLTTIGSIGISKLVYGLLTRKVTMMRATTLASLRSAPLRSATLQPSFIGLSAIARNSSRVRVKSNEGGHQEKVARPSNGKGHTGVGFTCRGTLEINRGKSNLKVMAATDSQYRSQVRNVKIAHADNATHGR